jgi:hypothetical protein
MPRCSNNKSPFANKKTIIIDDWRMVICYFSAEKKERACP